jgi:DNA polymerase elongation subunit (family B)
MSYSINDSNKLHELVGRIKQIKESHKVNSIEEVFKIPLGENVSMQEKYFVRTGLLSLYKNREMTFDSSLEARQSDTFHGGLIELNKQFTNKVIENVVSITFTGFYPSLIINHKAEISTMIGHAEIYEEVYNTYKNASSEQKKDQAYKDIKEYVNVTFGILANNKPGRLIRSAIDMVSIPRKGRMIIQALLNEFEGHYIYADTDSVYFSRYNEIEDRLQEHLDRVLKKNKYFGVEIEKYDMGLFIAKKRYLLIDEHGNRIYKGLKVIS